jgi:TetR/AcrR family transcriptional regulator, cholesterol catabolism regulator
VNEASPALRKSAATRQRVLDAAARAFREHGYAATTLSDIADAAGLRTASLYYHFGSKEELVEEVLRIGTMLVSDAVTRALGDLPPDTPFRDRLGAAVAAHLDHLLSLTDYTSANIRIIGHVPAEVRERVWPQREAYGEVWADLLRQGRASGAIRADADLGLLRVLILGTLNYASEWYKPDLKPVSAIATEATAMILDGVLSVHRQPA